MQMHNYLTKRDLVYLAELTRNTISCRGEEALREVITDIKQLVPHDFALCAMAHGISCDGTCISDIININYPSGLLESYLVWKYYNLDPVIKTNFTTYAVQFWADTYKRERPPKRLTALYEDFGLKEGYTHGLKNCRGVMGSMFCFAGRSVERNARHETILNYIVPHLHQSLIRIVGRPAKGHRPHLSEREREVILWLKEGKSTWDISLILRISERTVRFHIENVMRKLDAVNRTHAVAIALEQGLIEFE